MVARAQEAALAAVPEAPREVAAQVRRGIEPPFQIGGQHQVGIGGGGRLQPEAWREVAEQIAALVEAAVEHDRDRGAMAVRRDRREPADAARQRRRGQPDRAVDAHAHATAVVGGHGGGMREPGAPGGRTAQISKGDDTRHADPRARVPRGRIRDRISGAT